MSRTKLTISIDSKTVSAIDNLVKLHIFPNRSRMIELAVLEKLELLGKNRLASQCALLDPNFEKALADEGMGGATPLATRFYAPIP